MSDYNEIAQRAYEIWQESGRPEGKDLENWLKAEAEVNRREYKRNPGNESQQNFEDRRGRRNLITA